MRSDAFTIVSHGIYKSVSSSLNDSSTQDGRVGALVGVGVGAAVGVGVHPINSSTYASRRASCCSRDALPASAVSARVVWTANSASAVLARFF